MIKRAEEMNSSIKVNMRDGDGQVVITNLLDAGEYKGKSRLVATLTLEPGCSIGMHCHEDSCEIIYVLEGVGTAVLDGVEEKVEAGECHYCPKGHEHCFINNGKRDLVFFAVVPQQ